MNKLLGIIIILIIIVGGWYIVTKEPAPAMESGDESAMPADESMTSEMTVESPVTVTYTDEGYSPKSISIKKGQTVTWVNESSKDMWVASAMHPTHIVYSGTPLSEHCTTDANTAFDACKGSARGESYSFTFDKVGEWKYHDHIDASKFASVTVTEEETN